MTRYENPKITALFFLRPSPAPGHCARCRRVNVRMIRRHIRKGVCVGKSRYHCNIDHDHQGVDVHFATMEEACHWIKAQGREEGRKGFKSPAFPKNNLTLFVLA